MRELPIGTRDGGVNPTGRRPMSTLYTFQRILTNFTFGEKFANFDEFNNEYERTEQLWLRSFRCPLKC